MAALATLPTLQPTARVACSRLCATLSAAACATRHAARYPSGGRKGCLRFLPCGHCEVGASVLARIEAGGWKPPPDSLPAEVLESAQRHAAARWMRSFSAGGAPKAGELDPMREALLERPEDRGEPADPG